MSDGSKEKLKCVATYFPSKDRAEMKMNVRCASTGYKIDAKGTLRASSNSISGEFEERNYNLTGKVSGKGDGLGGIVVSIRGSDWYSTLGVYGFGARVHMLPKSGGAVRSINLNFSKG
jgi:hypothetical protein